MAGEQPVCTGTAPPAAGYVDKVLAGQVDKPYSMSPREMMVDWADHEHLLGAQRCQADMSSLSGGQGGERNVELVVNDGAHEASGPLDVGLRPQRNPGMFAVERSDHIGNVGGEQRVHDSQPELASCTAGDGRDAVARSLNSLKNPARINKERGASFGQRDLARRSVEQRHPEFSCRDCTAVDSPDCAMCTRPAARVKVPSSATATKYRSCRNSMPAMYPLSR